MTGKQIKEEREKRGLSIKAFAKSIGVSASTISEIEKGTRGSSKGISTGLADKIAAGFGLRNEYLIK